MTAFCWRLNATFSHAFARAALCGVLLIFGVVGCGSPKKTTPLPKAATTRSTTAPPKTQASVKPTSATPATSAWRTEGNKWIGTPYRYGGQTRTGMDCSGFACTVYRNVAKVNLPRTTSAQYQASRPIAANQVRPGDLLFFNTSGKGVSHVGISLGGDQFVHASTSRGVIISSFRETYYAKTFLGARRVLP